MTGLLVVNNFVVSQKSAQLHSFLQNAAAVEGVELCIKRSGELSRNIDDLGGLSCDFVLFWDKDVVLARMLEACGHRLFNPAKAIEDCDNKALTEIVLHNAGVPTPKTIVAPLTYEGLGYTNKSFIRAAVEALGFPLVIKELRGSFGQQVYLARSMDEIDDILLRIGHKQFLMQELVSTSVGRDVRINVVGESVVSAMLRCNEEDFRSNISNGGKASPVQITPGQEAVALKACRALGLDFAGVDVLFGENGEPVVCEVNSNPHFVSTFRCTGLDMSLDITRYIKRTLGK